jgi:hypothetical protein
VTISFGYNSVFESMELDFLEINLLICNIVMLLKWSYKMLIISAIFLKMVKRTRYKKSVHQLYSGDETTV